MKAVREKLVEKGIQASAPRLAIADFVLSTNTHPTAEDVKLAVESRIPSVSLATIYNTLNLFVEKGLVQAVRDPHSDSVRYDCNTQAHFHFYDEDSGRLIDLEPELLKIHPNFRGLSEKYEVSEIDVTLRGRVKKNRNPNENDTKE